MELCPFNKKLNPAIGTGTVFSVS